MHRVYRYREKNKNEKSNQETNSSNNGTLVLVLTGLTPVGNVGVVQAASTITLSNTSLSLKEGETYNLSVKDTSKMDNK